MIFIREGSGPTYSRKKSVTKANHIPSKKSVWSQGHHPANSRIIGLESLARSGSTEAVRLKAIAALKSNFGIEFKG